MHHMSKIEAPQSVGDLPLTIVKNMIGLATSGFGVVVGLAWNEVIKKAVADFVDPVLGKNGGLVSLLIYAAIMTILAVIVTMQLTQAQKGLETVTTIIRNSRKPKLKTAAKKNKK